MDKNSCYRVLSLQNDATKEQIERAYAVRIARLKSPDYADDPDYVQRKMVEAKRAYSMLTGHDAPGLMKHVSGFAASSKSNDGRDVKAARASKEAKVFSEKTVGDSCGQESSLKDRLTCMVGELSEKLSLGEEKNSSHGEWHRSEDRETREDREIRKYKKSLQKKREAGEERRKVDYKSESKAIGGQLKIPKLKRKTVVSQTLSESEVSDEKPFKVDSGLIISILTILIGLVSMFSAGFDSQSSDYISNEEQAVYLTDQLFAESEAVVSRQQNRHEEYDFESFLRKSKKDYSDMIEWEISDQDYCHLYFRGEQLATELGSTDFKGFVTYLTGEEDPFIALDDQDIVNTVAELMNPPDFSEVAGKVSTFTDEAILTYDDYYGFLVDIAADQTWKICDDLVYEY